MNENKQDKKNVPKGTGKKSRALGGFIGRGQGARRLTTVRVAPHMQLFPDRFRASCTTETNGTFTIQNSYTQTFKVNAPPITFGPRVNYTGSYGANAPSGINYLLSGLIDNGAGAPYSRYIVRQYQMYVTVASSSSTANTVPFFCGITFTTNETATFNMSFTQLPEQPRTMYVSLPATTTARPIEVANTIRCGELFGLSDREYTLQHENYGGSVVADPFRLAYAQLWLRSLDGTTTGSYTFVVRHRFEIDFFDLTAFDSTIPSLESKEDAW